MTNSVIVVAPRKHWTLRRKIFAGAGLLLAGAAVLVWWRVWQGGVNIGPLHGNVSSIASIDNKSFSASSASTDDSRVASKSIWIIPENENPLLTKVVAALKERLLQDKNIHEVKVGPRWQSSSGGIPDITVHIGIDTLDESDGPLKRHLHANVRASMVTGLPSGSGAVTLHSGSPLAGTWNGTLDHTSDSIGDGIGSDRYRKTAPHIAGQLADSLRKQLDEWRGKFREVPELPASFYPAFRAVTNLEFLKSMRAQEAASGNDLFSYNETYYTLQDTRNAKTIIADLADKLRAAGWKLADPADNSLHATHESRTFDFFARKDSSHPMPGLGAVPVVPPAPIYGMRYSDPVTEAERGALWRDVVSAGEWRIAGQYLLRSLAPEARAEYFKLLEAAPGKTSGDYYELANERERAHDRAAARKWLLRAAAIAGFEQMGKSPHMARMRGLAKLLGDEKMVEGSPAEETLKDMGIAEFAAAAASRAKSVEGKFPAGAALCAFGRDGEGALYLVSAQVTLAGKFKLIGSGPMSSSSLETEFQTASGIRKAELHTGMGIFVDAHAKEIGLNLYEISISRQN